MLEKIKSVLTRTPPVFPPASSPASTSDAIAAQQKKTAAQVERLRVELAATERAFTEAETAEGECLVDGRDATAATDARRQADDRVRTVKAALSVAIEKDRIALASLTDATRQAAITAADEANTAFKASVLDLEALLFGELKRAVEKVGVTRQVVIDRSEGGDGVGSAIRDFDLWFLVYRDRACAALVPSGRAYSKTLDEDKKPLSVWADNVAYAMSRRRKG